MVILVDFLWDYCENLVYARGLPWGITARLCPQEIAFGILEFTAGIPGNPFVFLVHKSSYSLRSSDAP